MALVLMAAIGDVERFAGPEKLVGYLGLNPSDRQSGSGPAYHGRITKQGRENARGMLVEAGWAAARSPGPLRSFFLRVQTRRGQHLAAVATARKLAILIWHLLTNGGSYLWARPVLRGKARTSRPALRHAVTCARQKVSKDRRKKRLSITSVDCGLSIGVVSGTKPISRASARVSRAV